MKKGFTLVEFLVLVAIVAIFGSIMFGVIVEATTPAIKQTLRVNKSSIAISRDEDGFKSTTYHIFTNKGEFVTKKALFGRLVDGKTYDVSTKGKVTKRIIEIHREVNNNGQTVFDGTVPAEYQ